MTWRRRYAAQISRFHTETETQIEGWIYHAAFRYIYICVKNFENRNRISEKWNGLSYSILFEDSQVLLARKYNLDTQYCNVEPNITVVYDENINWQNESSENGGNTHEKSKNKQKGKKNRIGRFI